MKTLFIIALLMVGISHAQEPKSLPMDLESAPTSTKPKKPVKSERPQPCAVIERACKAAGFKEFLHRDCVKPLLKGLPVKDANGTDVNTNDISLQQIKACQMYKEDNLKK